MNLLGIDVGSSSVKSAVLRDGKVVGKITRAYFLTRHEGVRVEVDPAAVLKAERDTVRELGPRAGRVEAFRGPTNVSGTIAPGKGQSHWGPYFNQHIDCLQSP